MAVSNAPRLGIVVPPENPTAEPEFGRLVGAVLNIHTTRFPVLPGLGLRDTLEAWNDVLPATLAGFGRLRLDAAVVACSASHYLLHPDGDRRFCDELSERAGFPVRSSTQAILAACESLGLTRLTLVSPYEPWLTGTSRGFWERAGLTVDRVVQIRSGDRFDPYLVTAEQLSDQLRRHGLAADSDILFTGTGMSTLDTLTELGAQHRGALLSSNLASAWWALRVTGARPGHPRTLLTDPMPSYPAPIQ